MSERILYNWSGGKWSNMPLEADMVGVALGDAGDDLDHLGEKLLEFIQGRPLGTVLYFRGKPLVRVQWGEPETIPEPEL